MSDFLVLSNDIVLRVEKDETFLLDRKSQCTKFFNADAGVLLSLFERPVSLKEFNSEVASLQNDMPSAIQDFIAQMLADCILVRVSDSQYNSDCLVFLNRESSHLSLPLGIEAELTLKCSRACSYCAYEAHPHAGQSDELSVKEWSDILRDFAENGGFYVRFTGGDPLLKPGFHEILTAADSFGLIITVGSDLTVLSEETIDCLAKTKNLYAIQTTLDGATKESADRLRGNGHFLATTNNIKRLRDRSIPVVVGTVIDRRNVSEISRIAALVGELGAQGYCVGPLYLAGRARQNQHQLHDLILNNDELSEAAMTLQKVFGERIVAPADPAWLNPFETDVLHNQVPLTKSPEWLIRIDPKGRVYPSIKLKQSLGDSVFVGDVRNASVSDIWYNSALLKSLRNQASFHPFFGNVVDTRTISKELSI